METACQVKEWQNPPRFKMVWCSCMCGGRKAWVALWKNGIEEMFGCICHTPLPPDAVVTAESI